MTTPQHEATAIARIVRECWAAALELPPEQIDASSSFFADGGDSLLAVELVSTLSDRLGVEVPLDPVLFDGTFGALLAASSDLVAADDAAAGP